MIVADVLHQDERRPGLSRVTRVVASAGVLDYGLRDNARAQPRPEHGQARGNRPERDEVIPRRRAEDWRSARSSTEQVQPEATPGPSDIQAE